MLTDIKELYVSAKGDRDFTEVAEALEAAKAYTDKEVIIHIAPGIYRERIVVNQDNISLIGAGAESTIITFSHYAKEIMPEGDNRGTFRTASVFIDADDFYANEITFRNEAGQGYDVGQAIAVYADGDHLVFENCRFDGYQDTLFTAPLPRKEMQPGGFKGPKEFAPRRVGKHFYKNCYIAGNIDFIFGGGIAYFEECEIFMKNRNDDKLSGYVTAPSTFEGQKYGYVFNHCRFTSDCPRETAYLGRPWRNHAKVVILNSEIGAHIKKEGWHDWDKKDAWETLFFAEYGNTGEGAADASQRAPFVTMLTEEEATEYTTEKVLGW